MDEKNKTREELLGEITSLRKRVSELEGLAAVHERTAAEACERYRQLFETSTDGIVIFSLDDGRVIDLNQAFLTLSGCSREILLQSRKFWELGPLKNTDVGQIIFKELRSRDNLCYDELPFETKDGKRIPVEMTCSVHLLESGGVVQCSVRDRTKRKSTEEELWRVESQYRKLFKEAAMGIAVVDASGRIIENNHKLDKMLGYREHELIGNPFNNFVYVTDAATDAALYEELLDRKRDSYQMAIRCIRKDGDMVWGLLAVSIIRDWAGKPLYALRMIEDITERKRAEEIIVKSRDFYLSLIDELPNPIRRTDVDAKCDYFNKDWLTFTGRTMSQEIGDAWTQGVHPEDRERLIKLQADAFRARGSYVTEYRLRYYTGEYHWLVEYGRPFNEMDGSFGGYLSSCYDVQDRKTFETTLHAMSTTDDLTGLLNRRGFFTLAQQQVKVANRNNSGLLLFYVDLDGLKKINDTLGHPEGDLALVETAEVLKEIFRASDIIGRLGGDEFAVLTLEYTGGGEEEQAILERLEKSLKTRNALPGRRYTLSISTGMKAYDPENPCSLDELISRADTLMYNEKKLKSQPRTPPS